MENITRATADKVLEAIRESGLSTREVAKHLNITKATLNSRLVGETDFSYPEMFTIGRILNRPLSDFEPAELAATA